MISSGDYAFMPRGGGGKACKICNGDVTPESKRRFYCSKGCADEAKLQIDRRRSVRTKSERVVFAEQRKKGCACHTRPAWPHKFDEDNVCQECGLAWEANQIPHPNGGIHPCTPDGEARAIRISEDKEKIKARRMERNQWKIVDRQRRQERGRWEE